MATQVKRRLPARKTLSLPVPTSTGEGIPLRVGALNVVTITAEAAGGNVAGFATCALDGSTVMPVAGAALTVGQPVYIDSSNVLTATSTSNTLFGVALTAKATGANDTEVMIVGN